MIREATPPTGYRQRTFRSNYRLTVPYHDESRLTVVYAKAETAPDADGSGTVEEEIARLAAWVAQPAAQAGGVQQGALPRPRNPRVVLRPGAYDVATGPPFRLVCDFFGGAIALNQATLEYARLPWARSGTGSAAGPAA